MCISQTQRPAARTPDPNPRVEKLLVQIDELNRQNEGKRGRIEDYHKQTLSFCELARELLRSSATMTDDAKIDRNNEQLSLNAQEVRKLEAQIRRLEDEINTNVAQIGELNIAVRERERDAVGSTSGA